MRRKSHKEPTPYCVIGRCITTVRNNGTDRTWLPSVEAATEHASALLAQGHNTNTEEILVVKIVRVVRKVRNHEVLNVT